MTVTLMVLPNKIMALNFDHGAIFHVADALAYSLPSWIIAISTDSPGSRMALTALASSLMFRTAHALQFSNAVQVVIVGQDGTIQLPGEDHQAIIHLAHAFHIDIGDCYGNVGVFLQFG